MSDGATASKCIQAWPEGSSLLKPGTAQCRVIALTVPRTTTFFLIFFQQTTGISLSQFNRRRRKVLGNKHTFRIHYWLGLGLLQTISQDAEGIVPKRQAPLVMEHVPNVFFWSWFCGCTWCGRRL